MTTLRAPVSLPLALWPALARRLAPALLALAALLLLVAVPARAGDPPAEAPLLVGSRTVFVFRAHLGAFSPAERAQAAQQHIAQALAQGGQGWTSVRLGEHGVLVELDGQPMFSVLAADAPPPGGLSADALANQASRQLQQAWQEVHERRDPQATAAAAGKVALALLAAAVALAAVWAVLLRGHRALGGLLARRLAALPDAVRALRLSPLLLGVASRACLMLAWLLSGLISFVFLAYALAQFALTRAVGEGLLSASSGLVLQSLGAAAAALPGLFVALLIFLVAWVVTQLSAELFSQVAAGRLRLGLLDAHTAPATRYLVNAALWLFALAMAYPYLPGAQTEAFKGLSVIIGLMVSLGATSVVGQVASGLILVYTRALLVGEYVRILDHEGTVSQVGLLLTRLRTGQGAEIALPNALVLGNVTRNFSRVVPGGGCVLTSEVSIGYDTPWRQVHALLLAAAHAVPQISRQPEPRVLQTQLADAYVVYRLLVVVASGEPGVRARTASSLNAAILDEFNRHGVQIMSPRYVLDPAQPKVVPESQWYAEPAVRPADAAAPTPPPPPPR